MKIIAKKLFIVAVLLGGSSPIFAQSLMSGSSAVTYSLFALLGVIIFGAIISVSNSLFRIQASKLGVDDELNELPSFFSFSSGAASGASGSKEVKALPKNIESKVLKKGFDLKLEGEADSNRIEKANVSTFAVQPKNFNGIRPIPKMLVEVGAEVKAGQEIFFDKGNPNFKFVAPVSGEVIEINRAEKRSIAEVVILADKEQSYLELPTINLETVSREKLIRFLADYGFMPHIKQRPFDLVPNLDIIPRDIFISTFDTAPLAPDTAILINGNEKAFQKGVDALSKLTFGKVHLGIAPSGPSSFLEVQNANKVAFSGMHPAGNVGVQIHHIAPIADGDDIVWTLNVEDVILLGNMFLEQKYIADRVIALTGAELNQPKYVRTKIGAKISDLLKDEIKGDNIRIVSGDVLSGEQKSIKGFVNIFDNQITVLKEGNEFEMFGWLLPLSPRPSISRTIPSFSDSFVANTNTHGEKRAFVVSGQYESVLPMDIYPQHLMKAILTNDIERMEGLGIYELAPEDVALCEFSCTSKQPLQQILKQGHDLMIQEG